MLTFAFHPRALGRYTCLRCLVFPMAASRPWPTRWPSAVKNCRALEQSHKECTPCHVAIHKTWGSSRPFSTNLFPLTHERRRAGPGRCGTGGCCSKEPAADQLQNCLAHLHHHGSSRCHSVSAQHLDVPSGHPRRRRCDPDLQQQVGGGTIFERERCDTFRKRLYRALCTGMCPRLLQWMGGLHQSVHVPLHSGPFSPCLQMRARWRP